MVSTGPEEVRDCSGRSNEYAILQELRRDARRGRECVMLESLRPHECACSVLRDANKGVSSGLLRSEAQKGVLLMVLVLLKAISKYMEYIEVDTQI